MPVFLTNSAGWAALGTEPQVPAAHSLLHAMDALTWYAYEPAHWSFLMPQHQLAALSWFLCNTVSSRCLCWPTPIREL